MSSTFDSGTAFDGIITFTYVPVGAISKTVHILLDGKEIATVTTTSSGRQMSYTIPAQKHGAHTLEAYFDATVNGQTIESNHLYYEIICVESLNTTPIIATSFQDSAVAQYTTLAIPFTVYDPANLTAEVELSVNGNKSDKDYSPTTMYNDYSISESLFHWQSQSTTAEQSPIGQHYIHHRERGSRVLLFVREFKTDSLSGGAAAYTFLGTANYLRHEGSRPMNITWRLDRPIPAKFLKKTKGTS